MRQKVSCSLCPLASDPGDATVATSKSCIRLSYISFMCLLLHGSVCRPVVQIYAENSSLIQSLSFPRDSSSFTEAWLNPISDNIHLSGKALTSKRLTAVLRISRRWHRLETPEVKATSRYVRSISTFSIVRVRLLHVPLVILHSRCITFISSSYCTIV